MRRWAGVLLLLALPAQAQIPLSSLRPEPRPPQTEVLPQGQSNALPPAPLTTPAPTLRPKARPAGLAPAAPRDQVAAQADASIQRSFTSLRPQPRPAGLAAKAVEQVAMAPQAEAAPEPKAKPETRAEARQKASRKGSVCGNASIKGEEIARITSKVKGCGIEDPVRITSVSGVRLNQPATIDCATATALNRWVERGLQPAFGRTKVVELRVAAHYICRPRNNIKGNKISEHGRGKAIDIAAVTLENGKTLTVAGHFGKELRRAHKAACGIFGTTLGPGSDGFHEDHMHFDTASNRNGPYCR